MKARHKGLLGLCLALFALISIPIVALIQAIFSDKHYKAFEIDDDQLGDQ